MFKYLDSDLIKNNQVTRLSVVRPWIKMTNSVLIKLSLRSIEMVIPLAAAKETKKKV